MNKQALDAANNINGKIATLGLEFSNRANEDRMDAGNVTIDAKNVHVHRDPVVKIKNHKA